PGSYNSGDANTGDTNSGKANVGDRNTGVFNLGDANTGWANTGDLNTGGFNTGDGNNGMFWRRDNGGQLNLALNIDVSQIPITLDGDIPVNIPITAGLGDLTLQSFTIPGFDITTTDWEPVHNEPVSTPLGTFYLDFEVPSGTLPISDITLDSVTVQLPQLSGVLGGSDTSIPLSLDAGIGPITITVPITGGPGLLNATTNPSSGAFNTGGGHGSGLLNSGTGVSGLWNLAAQQQPGWSQLSGLFNEGSLTSGLGNLGSGTSGLLGTSTLDVASPADLSGIANTGTDLSGFLNDSLSLDDYLDRIESRLDTPIPFSLDEILVSSIPFFADIDLPIDIPLSISATPIRISEIVVPQIGVGPGLVMEMAIKGSPTPPAANTTFRNPCTLACVAAQLIPVINVGPITIGPIEAGFVNDELVSLNIGGPGKGVGVNAAGELGPIVISLAEDTIEEFPYNYLVDIGVDLPIGGNTGELDLQEVDLSLALEVLLGTRVGFCTALVICPTDMTLSQFVTYVNGGTPPGSALGPFPPIPQTTVELLNDTLTPSLGPLTILPVTPISLDISENPQLSGSGTLGPFPLPF
ncbi:MAG: pentapeptide repeat-containing protein, partial [Mycolicibacterium sp.]